jgi:hypothetical protein
VSASSASLLIGATFLLLAGGMGTSWANDPSNDLVGIVLTTDAFASAFPPPTIIQDFWTCTYTDLDA